MKKVFCDKCGRSCVTSCYFVLGKHICNICVETAIVKLARAIRKCSRCGVNTEKTGTYVFSPNDFDSPEYCRGCYDYLKLHGKEK